MKKFITWSILSAFLMIGGPWVALQFPGLDAMGVCFLLFFAINPLFSAVCGAFAGRNISRSWLLPVVVAGLFVAGVWIFLDMGELDFLIYGAGYLLIGSVAMLISALIKRRA